MYAQQLGFASSWKILTRDKGWIKPMLVLTIVGWIPVVGQMAIFGYALEWARLTAWGVDAAPKQHGVDVGKVMSAAATIVGAALFGSWATAFALPMGSGLLAMLYTGIMSGVGALGSLGALVIGLALEAFIMAAMLRATIYDSFGAAWRVDRICQMVARDPGGFAHVYAVSLIGGLINWAYSALVSLIGTAVMVLGTAPGIIMVAVVCAIALLFVGSVIATVMRLLAVNAMGQWFCRFSVDRWGVSSAPLPDGVPVAMGDVASSTPRRPEESDTVGAQQAQGEPVQQAPDQERDVTVHAVPVQDAPVACGQAREDAAPDACAPDGAGPSQPDAGQPEDAARAEANRGRDGDA